jgi:hypothetical protein
MKTKVYVVLDSDYHGDIIMGIYAYKPKADERCLEDDNFIVVEHDVIL